MNSKTNEPNVWKTVYIEFSREYRLDQREQFYPLLTIFVKQKIFPKVSQALRFQ